METLTNQKIQNNNRRGVDMDTELIIGIALGIYFVAFVFIAIYKEKQVHKNKPKFDKDIK